MGTSATGEANAVEASSMEAQVVLTEWNAIGALAEGEARAAEGMLTGEDEAAKLS